MRSLVKMATSDLPRGTVTFLFTDVEGSTRLLKQLRERYGAVLDTHRTLLRSAFAEREGREVDAKADEFFVAFQMARDAVAAAAAAQRALASHHWADGASLRVRMGLHTGEPRLVEQRYFGLGVHRAARISAAAHGGQVLLSRATAGVVEDDEIEGVRLLDLGEHRLKDLDRPERIYQLVIEGLPHEFPPLLTAEAEAAAAGTRPSGTVTMLFTDIEGSTWMVRRLGRERFGDVLSSYHRLLRRVLVEHGGEEIQSMGDFAIASFPTANQAVLAAAALQRALAAHQWPEGREPRTRIGLHSGEAGVGIQRYVGLTPNRTSQICEAAHGSQVLLSEATRSLLDEDEFDDLTLRSLGHYPIKPYFDQKVRLYQLVIRGLPDEFPPLPSERPLP